jgi:hypothetical protein
VDEGLERLAERDVLVVLNDQIRVRDRVVLRYYARSLQHLWKARKERVDA